MIGKNYNLFFSGEIEYCDTANTVIVKHVEGDGTLTWDGLQLLNPDNNANTTINTSSTRYVLDPAEAVYWSPVNFYDYENNLNESKRYIYLIDKNYAQQTAENIRKKLNA